MEPSRVHATLLVAGAVLAFVCAVGPAAAASQRTFVSTAGVDNPACSVASPCRTFMGAVAATTKRGEVIVLDSGGYGQIIITQSISIIAPPGVYAGVSVSSGDGITITTANNDSVTLRGLTINNVASCNRGIHYDGDGYLQLDDVRVIGCSAECLRFAPSANGHLKVEGSTFAYCGWGIVIAPVALGRVFIERSVTHHNESTGIYVADNAKVVVRASSSVFNDNGVWAFSQVPGNATELIIESSDLSNNGTGLLVGLLAGPASASVNNSTIAANATGVATSDNGTVLLGATTISRNNIGVACNGTGVAKSQGNNLISGNSITDGCVPTVVGSK